MVHCGTEMKSIYLLVTVSQYCRSIVLVTITAATVMGWRVPKKLCWMDSILLPFNLWLYCLHVSPFCLSGFTQMLLHG